VKLSTRLWNFVVAQDQAMNCLFGSGWADETYSAYCYRVSKWQLWWIDKLFFWQKHHCLDAYLTEVNRQHLPKGYKDAANH
jgi:hypothetical protein